MADAVLHAGWRWEPTWHWQRDGAGRMVKAWTGFEYLCDAAGRQVVELMDGTGWGVGSGGAVFRKAPPPSRPPISNEEMRRMFGRRTRA